jgi:hypothetical protein
MEPTASETLHSYILGGGISGEIQWIREIMYGVTLKKEVIYLTGNEEDFMEKENI